MSRVFERPLAARRAHPGFILVKHDGLAAGNPEGRKYPLELRAELGDAALGGIGMMKREGIEVARADQMTGVEILGRARIDEDHAGVAKALLEPSCVNCQFFRIHCFDLSIYSYCFADRTKAVAAEQV